MNIVSILGQMACKSTMPAVLAVALAANLSLIVAAQAQQAFSEQRSIYIDGSTPVDAYTRARVDAHFDQIRNEQMAKAEERERLNRFIYHDNTFGAQQVGRW